MGRYLFETIFIIIIPRKKGNWFFQKSTGFLFAGISFGTKRGEKGEIFWDNYRNRPFCSVLVLLVSNFSFLNGKDVVNLKGPVRESPRLALNFLIEKPVFG